MLHQPPRRNRAADTASAAIELLESRRLLSLVVDLRLPGGGKTLAVTGPGQTINLELWATVTGANSTGADDGLQIAAGSLLSTNISGGAASGTLSATLVTPFNDIGSQNGSQTDLDADGDLDVGSNTNSSATGFIFARAPDVLTSGGIVSGASNAFQIGTATFTVTSLGSGTQTNLLFRPRAYFSAALWSEEGAGRTVVNGTFSAGSPVILTRTVTATASISGKIFHDANANGAFDSTETGLANVKVFLDTDRDGFLDTNETSVLTDASGNYKFSNLPAGPYRIREVAPAGYKVTAPGAGYVDRTLAAGQSLGSQNFANRKIGSIAGRIFNDKNANGIFDSASESGIASVRVYLDLNKNGKFDSISEPSKITGSSGTFTFTGLLPATYRLRQVALAGNRITTPGAAYFDIPINGNPATNKNFGDTTNVLIKGRVWIDTDHDGVQDSNEGLANWRVFIDKDRDGKLEPGEVSTLTDSFGYFRFATLPAGSYQLRVVQQSGYHLLSPLSKYFDFTLLSGASISNKLFLESR